jgi:hypothetical protein
MTEMTGFGQKAGDADLFGIPNRIILSDKTLEKGGYELKRSEKKIHLPLLHSHAKTPHHYHTPFGMSSSSRGDGYLGSREESIYRDPDLLPTNQVWLLLGTTPSVNGVNNIFFSTRIEAAKTLYERGKIEHILVSCDNSTKAYNEPEAMRKALVKAGIPESDITLDYAGFRTLDSVVRAKEIFGQWSGFTIISQPFHVERATFSRKGK